MNKNQIGFRFGDMIPFEVEEFKKSFDIVMRAAGDKSAVPEPVRVIGEDEFGIEQEFTIGALHPLASAADQIVWLYGDDPAKYFSMAARFFAFTKTLHDPDYDEWCVKLEKEYDIDDAMIEAAATARLTENGEFAKAEFIASIRRLIEERRDEGYQ